MGKFIITEEEKNRIRSLHEKSQEQLKYEEIQSLELSDCQRVVDNLSKDNIIDNKNGLQNSFDEVVRRIKNSNGGMLLLNDLILMMTSLCIFMQIMTTSKDKEWGIPKDFFQPMYNTTMGVEYHFNNSKASKVILFLKEFREMYENY